MEKTKKQLKEEMDKAWEAWFKAREDWENARDAREAWDNAREAWAKARVAREAWEAWKD